MVFWGILSGVVGLAGYIPYIRQILKGLGKPDRASWCIWLLQYGLLFFAQFAKGATDSQWLAGLVLVGTAAVCILSFRYGVGGFTKQNSIVIGCVCAALILWYVTRDASLAIVISVLVEAAGVVLTVFKVYKHPGYEPLTMWKCQIAAGLLSIPAITPGSALVLYLYPAAFVLFGVSVVAADHLSNLRARKRTTAFLPEAD